jgi:hypothetical protein
MTTTANILTVPGQGAWDKHRKTFRSEYVADTNVFIGHAASVERLKLARDTWVVLSGGSTQESVAPEAESYKHLWSDLDCWPCRENRVIAETVSLDSAENLAFSLLKLRQHLGASIRIGHVSLYCCWRGKKRRFTGLAEMLGLNQGTESRFSFDGFADWNAASEPEKARRGEEDQLRRMDGDFLLRKNKEWESKRNQRFQGPSFADRLPELQSSFPEFFECLDRFSNSNATEEEVRQEFLRAIGPLS